jgi:hypothetical protein
LGANRPIAGKIKLMDYSHWFDRQGMHFEVADQEFSLARHQRYWAVRGGGEVRR